MTQVEKNSPYSWFGRDGGPPAGVVANVKLLCKKAGSDLLVSKAVRGHSGALERIQAVTGCKTQQELAEFLSVKQSSISYAKKRGTIPPEWLLKLLRRKGVNPDWILTGKGPRFLCAVEGEEKATIPVTQAMVKTPDEWTLEELVAELVKRGMVSLRDSK